MEDAADMITQFANVSNEYSMKQPPLYAYPPLEPRMILPFLFNLTTLLLVLHMYIMSTNLYSTDIILSNPHESDQQDIRQNILSGTIHIYHHLLYVHLT